VVDFAPLIAENDDAPGASEYHCTVGAEQFAGVDPPALNVAVAGALTVWLEGCSVIAGDAAHDGAFTVRVAALLGVAPWALVNTARKRWPDSVVLVWLIWSVVAVAPDTLLQVLPLFVETCHWMAAAEQLAASVPSLTVKLAAAGAVTVWLAGWVAIDGDVEQAGALTVRVAALLAVSPLEFLNTASYLVPLCEVVVAGVV
jgi:hypothetical protein